MTPSHGTYEPDWESTCVTLSLGMVHDHRCWAPFLYDIVHDYVSINASLHDHALICVFLTYEDTLCFNVSRLRFMSLHVMFTVLLNSH